MLLLLDYFLCCWCRHKTEEVEEEDLLRELDSLEREFRNYKAMKKKKSEAAKREKKHQKL
jgi:hypothetical protein